MMLEAAFSTNMLQAAHPKLVLASASSARRQLLLAAGLRFEAMATSLDEAAVELEARVLGEDAPATALHLARLKAACVDRPGAMIIGCDQILVCDGIWYDKPANRDIARAHLQALHGRAHTLATATVVLRDGVEVWRHAAAPRLAMRRLSDRFIDLYLADEGDRALETVGAYRLEGRGMHLFETVEGEHTAILGLPMLPFLGFLRDCNIISS